MHHETPSITGTTRERLGTRYARRLRQAGRLPAVIYGHKIDPVAISVDRKEALEILEGGAHLVNVSVDEGSPEICLVRELQFGFLGDDVIHMDLARVSLDEEVEVNVHLRFVGVPESAKKPGAILTHELTEIEVVCRASDIPSEIKVDLSQMEDSFTVGEIILPEGIRTPLDPTSVVAQISFVHEEAEGEEVEVEGAEEPEVITEAKKKEEEEEGEEKPSREKEAR